MPIFSRALEKTLRRALSLANERRHEYATLEHLLLALIDDVDAAAVLRACGVDLDALRKTVVQYLDTELENLVVESQEEAKATNGFQRVVQRAVVLPARIARRNRRVGILLLHHRPQRCLGDRRYMTRKVF